MRSKDDLCLICNLNKSDNTNSHFIPAGLLKSNIGKRDYEEAYTIDITEQIPITDYYGRSNLKNADIVIKQNPHSADYIFCSICETKLSDLENEFIPFLNSLKSEYLNNQNKVLTFNNINVRKFKLFIYTLIYRLNLQSIIRNGLSGIDFHLFDKLRAILCNHFTELDYLVDTSIDFTVFASLAKKYNYTKNFVGINTFFINPLLMVNEFHIVPYVPPFPLINAGFENTFAHYQDLEGRTTEDVKIFNVENKKWKEVQEQIVNYQAYQFKTIRIEKLMLKTNQSFEDCQKELYNLAEKIHKETRTPFGLSYDEAFIELIK